MTVEEYRQILNRLRSEGKREEAKLFKATFLAFGYGASPSSLKEIIDG